MRTVPRGLTARLRQWEIRTRPVDAESAAAAARRWAELPDHVKTDGQLIGRRSTGCEGTHGVFPACDFACKPCYHSKDANKVRVDGAHTLEQVTRQMAFLREHRGPAAFAQLIGGEVSLLAVEDHSAALEAMRAQGRSPMSMTHGDFDDDYLQRVVLRADGTRRFASVSFAAHIDSTMYGRRGSEKPNSEAELQEHRQRFTEMFARLRSAHGVRSYLAHNMTVTPENLHEVAEVIRASWRQGWRMFSFQPAAYVGSEARWRAGFRSMTDDDVWTQIELGAGRRLPYRVLQFGDTRCNRTSWGAFVADRYVPLLDEDDSADLAARDAYLRYLPGNYMTEPHISVKILRVARLLMRRPPLVLVAGGWLRRFARRAGGLRALRSGIRPVTFVMHSFMDATVVAPAWELLRRGEVATDATVLVAQERLQACTYAMAHPESGEIVPACVQHSLLDAHENRQLVELLPLPTRRSSTRAGSAPGVGS
ncbi:MAG: radical SAM domain-containing protein [Actinobacteria bacterium]|nr:radical SAM domain-containing protein [Actinomycetota bacterium]